MNVRFRHSALIVFWAWVGFVLAGLGFGGVLDDNPFMNTNATAGLRLAVYGVQAGAWLALLAVMAGGLPVAYAMVRRALATGRRDVLMLLAVPPLCGVIVTLHFAVLVVVANAVKPAAAPTAFAVALFVGFVALFAASAVVCTVAVSVAASRIDLGDSAYRAVHAPAILAALAMGFTLFAVVMWGVAAYTHAPQLFETGPGLWGVRMAVAWVAIVAAMAVATAVAATASLRGLADGR